MRVRTPAILLLPVWPLPRSLATTDGISVDVFSSPYLDVSVQAVPRVYLLIQYALMRYCRTGFPHSDISGSKLICSSPKLFAACHVLHRLLMPRHSPCALLCLTCRRACSVSFVAELAHRLTRSAALLFAPCPVASLPGPCRGVWFAASLFLRHTHNYFKQKSGPISWFSFDSNYADSFVLPTKL